MRRTVLRVLLSRVPSPYVFSPAFSLSGYHRHGLHHRTYCGDSALPARPSAQLAAVHVLVLVFAHSFCLSFWIVVWLFHFLHFAISPSLRTAVHQYIFICGFRFPCTRVPRLFWFCFSAGGTLAGDCLAGSATLAAYAVPVRGTVHLYFAGSQFFAGAAGSCAARILRCATCSATPLPFATYVLLTRFRASSQFLYLLVWRWVLYGSSVQRSTARALGSTVGCSRS